MNRSLISRVLCIALTLTMICGALTVLPVSALDESTVVGYSRQDAWVTNWTGSPTLTNGGWSSSQVWVSQDGDPYNPYVGFTSAYQESISIDGSTGVLTLTDLPTDFSMQLYIQKSDITNADSMALVFDVYYENGSFPGLQLKLPRHTWSGKAFMSIGTDGAITFPYYSRVDNSGKSLAEGWNTVVLYNVNTYTDSTLSGVTFYLDVLNSTNPGILDLGVTEEDLADMYQRNMTQGSTYDRELMTLRGYAASGGATLSMLSATGTLQMRNIRYSLLTPEQDLYTVTFEGYDAYTAHVPADGGSYEITLPAVAGINAWQDQNGVAYTPGQDASVSSNMTFSKAGENTTYSGYSFHNVYEPKWENQSVKNHSWGYSCMTVNGATDWSPVLQWATSTGVAFDSAENTITVTGQSLDYEMQFLTQNVLAEGAAAISIDVYFDGETFSGVNLFAIKSGLNKSLLSVDKNGYLLDSDLQPTSQRMTVGWNTLHLYAIPRYDAQDTWTGLTLYTTLGTNDTPTSYSYGITEGELAGMQSFTLTTEGNTDLKNVGALRIRPVVQETYDDTNYRSYTFRSIRVMNLTETDDLLKVSYEGVGSLNQYISSIASTTPLTLGRGLWTDAEGNYYRGGDKLILEGHTTLTPVKLSAANLALDGQVTLNMKLSKAVVDAYGATEARLICQDKTYDGILEGEYYVFAVEGIRAYEMGVTRAYTFSLTIDGDTVSTYGAVEYSPMIYAQRKYGKETSSQELNNVVAAMVQYAYAAEVSAKGASAILDEFNAATGASMTFSTDAYTQKGIEVDTSAISGMVRVGATLTQGIQLRFDVTEEITALEVVGIGTFQAENGSITVSELHAGMLTSKLTLRFVTAEGTLDATYSVANFLDGAAANEEFTVAQRQLAMATSIYMSAVAEYVESE
ncbi:MAG: hypothetical protein IJC29_05340 [Clostridia bacterium]|nr:hypothetical protein [Clostridia bacterium]